jgi:hypothetical protein
MEHAPRTHPLWSETHQPELIDDLFIDQDQFIFKAKNRNFEIFLREKAGIRREAEPTKAKVLANLDSNSALENLASINARIIYVEIINHRTTAYSEDEEQRHLKELLFWSLQYLEKKYVGNDKHFPTLPKKGTWLSYYASDPLSTINVYLTNLGFRVVNEGSAQAYPCTMVSNFNTLMGMVGAGRRSRKIRRSRNRVRRISQNNRK